MDLTKLLLSTDTDTLKNDGSATASATIAGSATVAAAGRLSVSVDVTVGKANSSALCFFQNSKEGIRSYTTQGAQLQRTGVASGSSAPYNIVVTATRIGTNTIRFTASAANPYNVALTLAAGNEVFTFLAKTIVEPF